MIEVVWLHSIVHALYWMSFNLHLHGLAVDKLNAGHNRVEDDGRLLAAIQNDVVAFTLDKRRINTSHPSILCVFLFKGCTQFFFYISYI